MTLSIDRFDEFFVALYDRPPFPWQRRLARRVYESGWPDCIDLPTASGKTACIDVAIFVLACQAGLSDRDRTVGRRIFFTVNRRVIVDEAFERARKLAQRLIDDQAGIVAEVASALREMNEDAKAPPLEVAQLRGGIFRDHRWASSLTQPTVICTTADQLGSRLLFRGYGVSQRMQPIHAALCACDSLILLDEAHITRAFSQTLDRVCRYRETFEPDLPPLRYVQMTATPTEGVASRFALDDEDLGNDVLKARQEASKPADLISLGKANAAKLVETIAQRAVDSVSADRRAVGVMVNRVHTARQVEVEIRKRLEKAGIDAEIHLVIGRMRPLDREKQQEELARLIGPDRDRITEPLEKPVFVVATQTLEVGADYDFDALITECASIDALRQRFGRLNRQGRAIEAAAAIVVTDAPLKSEDPIYGEAIRNTWEWLTQGGRSQIDFGIRAFQRLWDSLSNEERSAMLAPSADAAVLLPAHLDALCQTAPPPTPSPDVAYFIHGPQRDNREVQVCWRADLSAENGQYWKDIVALLPPTSLECMTVPLRDVQRWMAGQGDKLAEDADMPVASAPEEEKLSEASGSDAYRVVIWRGANDSECTTNPQLLRPGDTIVIPVFTRSWQTLGHIPGLSEGEDWRVDVAEAATRKAKRRVAVRLHPAFPGREDWRKLLLDDLRNTIRNAFESELPENERESVLRVMGPLDRHLYPGGDDDDDGPQDTVIYFRQRIEPPKALTLPPIEDEDDDGDLSEIGAAVTLERHTEHVVDKLRGAVTKLHRPEATSLSEAARLHDLGKLDARFQALLLGSTPYEALERQTRLAKSPLRQLTRAERAAAHQRSKLPPGFRHEMLSLTLADRLRLMASEAEPDLVLHLIASHHGYARPFAPVVFDNGDDELLECEVDGHVLSKEERLAAAPHRLDSGVAERFWRLTRKYGWWGLAFLESILRLADHRASEDEVMGG